MPRLPALTDRDAMSEGVRRAYDHIMETRGTMSAPNGMLLYAEDAASLFSDFTEHVRYQTVFSTAETELAIMVTARATDSPYMWGSHVRLGMREGISEETVDVIDRGAPLDSLGEDEARIVRFGRELMEEKQLSQAAFNAVRERYGEKGVMQLVGLMGAYYVIGLILRATDYEAGANARPLSPRT
jgi:4-carboxymuconolactone decarboxylase